uniref:Si:ch211-117l17.7 n=1 Tax=Astyanax mexicanus TaxID=7994 RepID=A0A8B9KW76_ASTMX
MWLIFLLLQLASLLPFGFLCPNGCVCFPDGGVQCTGAITDIPAPQLRSIKLSSNALSVLPPGVFRRLVNLEQLHLDGNQLVSLSPDMFEGLGNLTELDISKNQISQLDANTFQDMTSLYHLNLAGNLLRKLPQTLFHNLMQLKSLILTSNKLETLEEGSFDHLHNLLVLMLHKNQIQDLPPKLFWHMPSLLTLTMSGNQLSYLPAESLYFLPNLTKLTLYNNPLISLPDQLVGRMPRLKELYLYNTNLSTVPWNLFANMTGLMSLNLHINEKLTSLPRNLFSRIFYNLPKLAKLELSNNYLKNLPGDTFLDLNSLQSVTLGHNRWDCTCSITGFVEWLNQNQRVVSDVDDVLCHKPQLLQNRKLTSLTFELCCQFSKLPIQVPEFAFPLRACALCMKINLTDCSVKVPLR